MSPTSRICQWQVDHVHSLLAGESRSIFILRNWTKLEDIDQVWLESAISRFTYCVGLNFSSFDLRRFWINISLSHSRFCSLDLCCGQYSFLYVCSTHQLVFGLSHIGSFQVFFCSNYVILQSLCWIYLKYYKRCRFKLGSLLHVLE